MLYKQLAQWVSEVHIRAKELNNEWDKKAIEWPFLNEHSVVWDVGTYRGRWALQIAKRYNPQLFCFEPQTWAYNVAKDVLCWYPNVYVFNYALGTEDAHKLMALYETDGCSLVFDTSNTIPTTCCKMCDIVDEYEARGKPIIDLMSMNIEEYEHILLPYMFDNEIYPQRLMIQLHGDEPSVNTRLLLNQYYNPIWDYGNTLSAWELKSND